MSRSKNNRQVNVGISRTDEMLGFYIEEAKLHGVQLPSWFLQLLRDRYLALTGKGSQSIWFPRGEPVFQASPVVAPLPDTNKADAIIDALGGEDED